MSFRFSVISSRYSIPGPNLGFFSRQIRFKVHSFSPALKGGNGLLTGIAFLANSTRQFEWLSNCFCSWEGVSRTRELWKASVLDTFFKTVSSSAPMAIGVYREPVLKNTRTDGLKIVQLLFPAPLPTGRQALWWGQSEKRDLYWTLGGKNRNQSSGWHCQTEPDRRED